MAKTPKEALIERIDSIIEQRIGQTSFQETVIHILSQLVTDMVQARMDKYLADALEEPIA